MAPMSPGPIVLDASVTGAFVFKESKTPLATAVCARIVSGELEAYVPDLYWAELQNICRRKRDEQGLSQSDIELAYRDATALPVAEEDDSLLRHRSRAWELIGTVAQIGSYDFYYLALAEHLSAPVWTFDARFRNAVVAAGGTLSALVQLVGTDVTP
jgi:predicted nucleic acid-binding protein